LSALVAVPEGKSFDLVFLALVDSSTTYLENNFVCFSFGSDFSTFSYDFYALFFGGINYLCAKYISYELNRFIFLEIRNFRKV
jgi:hypothetical protein